jgi:hypothetical protein
MKTIIILSSILLSFLTLSQTQFTYERQLSYDKCERCGCKKNRIYKITSTNLSQKQKDCAEIRNRQDATMAGIGLFDKGKDECWDNCSHKWVKINESPKATTQTTCDGIKTQAEIDSEKRSKEEKIKNLLFSIKVIQKELETDRVKFMNSMENIDLSSTIEYKKKVVAKWWEVDDLIKEMYQTDGVKRNELYDNQNFAKDISIISSTYIRLGALDLAEELSKSYLKTFNKSDFYPNTRSFFNFFFRTYLSIEINYLKTLWLSKKYDEFFNECWKRENWVGEYYGTRSEFGEILRNTNTDDQRKWYSEIYEELIKVYKKETQDLKLLKFIFDTRYLGTDLHLSINASKKTKDFYLRTLDKKALGVMVESSNKGLGLKAGLSILSPTFLKNMNLNIFLEYGEELKYNHVYSFLNWSGDRIYFYITNDSKIQVVHVIKMGKEYCNCMNLNNLSVTLEKDRWLECLKNWEEKYQFENFKKEKKAETLANQIRDKDLGITPQK